ncbi:MAG: lysophospholipid acyltransferase family protein [Deltaproteobacteria bacterium]|nr:lysophospholipid acyltransferase family protein [Deltaproteobacteria bacterium]
MSGELPPTPLDELSAIGSRLLAQMPARDLLTMLFPPALARDVLRAMLGESKVEDAGFDPALPEKAFADAVLDLGRWLGKYWFHATIEGLERFPVEGPALVVANHNAGIMPLDAIIIMAAIRDRHGEGRVVHPLAHDFAYAALRVRRHARRLGILRASPKNAVAALAAGRIVLVYPGGDREAFRPFAERGKISLGNRKGFARLALETGAPIIPMVTAGLHEAFVVLSSGRRLARLLRTKEILRTETVPVALALPWGIIPAVLPYIPLPTAVDIRFGEPIRLAGAADDPATLDAGYRTVETVMQSMMDELSEGRVPWLGRGKP